jgi:hypothetical protein
MIYQYIMNKKIYLLIVLALAFKVSFGQQMTPEGKDSLKLTITRFGQLLDLSSASGAKQTSVRPVDRNAAEEFKSLFNAFTLDTLRAEKDSLVIVSFLDPNIGLFDCYMIKNTNDSLLRHQVDSCLNTKKTLETFPKLSVNQFIDTVFKYYTQTISDINENDIQPNFESVRHIHKKRYQVVADAPLKEFRGNVDVNYSTALGRKEYRYQAPDLQKMEQLPINLRFYVSYDVYSSGGRKGETNFKIDSVTLVRPVKDIGIQQDFTKSRGYLEPFIGYGLSFPKLTTDDPRFDDLSKDNSVMLEAGLNGTFFFNNRKFSPWDVGFTTGAAYKSLRSNYSLESYSDSLVISDDYTAEQLGGEYDLYANATALDQHNRINVLEVPMQFAVNYNFSPKRTLGLYGRIGGLFNLVVSNKHEMNGGSVTYTGHVERLIDGTYTDYYFNSDLPEYGFSTYEADVDESNELALNDFYISGKLNFGVFGMNKVQTVGWHIGTFFEMDITDMLESGHEPNASLTRGQGHMNSFYDISDQLMIHNWGLEFGISIQLFKEKITYLKSK